MATTRDPEKVWEPVNPKQTQMWQLIESINRKHNLKIQNYEELHKYSVEKLGKFWSDCFDFLDLIHSGSYTEAVDESKPVDTIPRWFKGVSLNFTENMLYSRTPELSANKYGVRYKEDTKIAVTEVREGLEETSHFDWGTLRADSGRLAAALAANGITTGSRVFAVASNSYATLTLFLAMAWIGGIFSSVSPDMGVSGILERAKQITPELMFMDDGVRYNGKLLDLSSKIQKIAAEMKRSPGFRKLVLLQRFSDRTPLSIPETQYLAELLSSAVTAPLPPFEQLPFHAPVLICYSSGTTGQPKCIVHSVGSLVLNLAKETQLHADIGPDSVVLQYTTTGWIMYLACVACIRVGARTVLYDGSPFVPGLTSLLELASREKVTVFGTSPKWMNELAKRNVSPKSLVTLSSLKVVTSTGMVLSDELFRWFYGSSGFPPTVRLANMSGGTDIAGCFALGNPISPVYVGGCQGPALGTAVEVYDMSCSYRDGRPVAHGTQGELVATKPFPNVPIMFWSDTAPPTSAKSKLFSSYFSKFEHAWAQGDLVSVHPLTKAIIFHGRADGVLNPSGIRFGSAEIYGVLERRFSGIVVDSLCVGQKRPSDSDESVLLFLQMAPGKTFDDSLIARIKGAIKDDLSPRHVPKHIFETPEIPVSPVPGQISPPGDIAAEPFDQMTATFKKLEVPVKQIVSGRKVTPGSTVVNPHSLDYFYQFADLGKSAKISKL